MIVGLRSKYLCKKRKGHVARQGRKEGRERCRKRECKGDSTWVRLETVGRVYRWGRGGFGW